MLWESKIYVCASGAGIHLRAATIGLALWEGRDQGNEKTGT
jgi:hypothetical protein